MSKFSKGDKVVNINTKEKGFIIEVYPMKRGRQLYKVKYDDRENAKYRLLPLTWSRTHEGLDGLPA
jgi:hypothetical protein